jgi:hypothetical protein
MSKILDTANGESSLDMDFDIDLYDYFDLENPKENEKEALAACQAFIEEYGDFLSVEVFAEISEGYAMYAGYGNIYSGRTCIDPSKIPDIILSDIEDHAKSCAEEYGLGAYF